MSLASEIEAAKNTRAEKEDATHIVVVLRLENITIY